MCISGIDWGRRECWISWGDSCRSGGKGYRSVAAQWRSVWLKCPIDGDVFAIGLGHKSTQINEGNTTKIKWNGIIDMPTEWPHCVSSLEITILALHPNTVSTVSTVYMRTEWSLTDFTFMPNFCTSVLYQLLKKTTAWFSQRLPILLLKIG